MIFLSCSLQALPQPKCIAMPVNTPNELTICDSDIQQGSQFRQSQCSIEKLDKSLMLAIFNLTSLSSEYPLSVPDKHLRETQALSLSSCNGIVYLHRQTDTGPMLSYYDLAAHKYIASVPSDYLIKQLYLAREQFKSDSIYAEFTNGEFAKLNVLNRWQKIAELPKSVGLFISEANLLKLALFKQTVGSSLKNLSIDKVFLHAENYKSQTWFVQTVNGEIKQFTAESGWKTVTSLPDDESLQNKVQFIGSQAILDQVEPFGTQNLALIDKLMPPNASSLFWRKEWSYWLPFIDSTTGVALYHLPSGYPALEILQTTDKNIIETPVSSVFIDNNQEHFRYYKLPAQIAISWQ